jgi:hypothetical protein
VHFILPAYQSSTGASVCETLSYIAGMLCKSTKVSGISEPPLIGGWTVNSFDVDPYVPLLAMDARKCFDSSISVVSVF